MFRPPRTPRPLTYADITERLDYDPATGIFRWKRGYSRNVKAGDVAGTINKAGYTVICIKGRKYPAMALAYMLTYKRWPKHALRYRITPEDNRIENIIEYVPEPSSTPAAQAMRRYRERLRQKDEKPLTNADKFRQEPHPAYSHVIYSDRADEWIVYDSESARAHYGLSSSLNRELSRHKERQDALDASDEYDYIASLVGANPPPDLDTLAAQRRAGPPGSSVTLAEAHAHLYYDETTGVFYWRLPHIRAGKRADEPENPEAPKRSPRGFYISTRWYAAHNMAWFLAHGEWPKRRAIYHINNDPSDNALHNLAMRQDAEE